MDTKKHYDCPIRIEGGRPLHGTVYIQGSKNASLPILAACTMISGRCILHQCPDITDVHDMLKIIEAAGGRVERCGNTICIDATLINECHMPSRYVKEMRSSVIMLGALLSRMRKVCIDYPGGCVIGERPIDLHLQALQKLGAEIETQGNCICASAKQLKGARITFPFSSVGATQNAVMAAVMAEGITYIENAAKEPEVIDLCRFLNMAGAKIAGVGTSFLVVEGVESLHEIEYTIVPDRIVAGTYLFTVLGTGGDISLHHAPIDHLQCVIEVIRQMGAKVCVDECRGMIRLQTTSCMHNIRRIETDVYPGFPTDLQSSLLMAACVVPGEMCLYEHIFSDRFKIVEELNRMGADIRVEKGCAFVRGGQKLIGRNVIAKELRGGAALVAAGLAAQGITTVMDTCYIHRGYENIGRDLAALGAKISECDERDLF